MSGFWYAVLLAGVGTYAMRASFLVVADRFERLDERVEVVLAQIPPAVLAALVVPSVLRAGGSFDVLRAEVLSAVVAGLVCWKTRNVTATLLIGMAVLLAIRAL